MTRLRAYTAPLAVVLLALLAVSCTGLASPVPLLPGAPLEAAITWLQDLVRVGESACRERGTGTSRLCRGYQDHQGHHYIAVHDRVTLELLRILEVRESPVGPVQDLLWHPTEHRPSSHRVQGVAL